ncbi:MAG: XRE family transcriptional regulator [Syntrophorhabdaceae bacterium]|nr:XRE family transcriptional regulator [Syntrophorhabdaceae bacterium]HOC45467.1 XRE family transcriptional regulator [Syntrophorhabdaceae bacterium]
MDQKTLAKRLKAARERVGLSVIDAAKRLGYKSYQTLSSIEKGERKVKASELTSFAREYFCSLDSLLAETFQETKMVLLWRKSPEGAAKKELESAITYHCEQYRSLERLLGYESIGDLNFFDLRISNISTPARIDSLANNTWRLLELGSRPAFTLKNILEQTYGVKFIYQPLASISSAASTVHPDFGPVIVVNSDEAPWRRNYDLAHELFHLITWKIIPTEELNGEYLAEVEKKAERFASALLLPEPEVRKAIDKVWQNQRTLAYADIVDIARDFGVSTVALLYRLSAIGCIKWETANKLAGDESLANLDKKKRADDWGDRPVSDRFHSLAVKCLRKGLLSRGKFAEIVGIDRSEIDLFIEGEGLMETEGESIEIMAPRC